MEIAGLKNIKTISRRLINQKKSPFVFKSVTPKKVISFEQDGWEVVPSKLKKSVKMRRNKPHYSFFIDRIWALFAQMEFDFLNDDIQFGDCSILAPWVNEINVLAVDNEAILIVKCISSKVRSRGDYQDQIRKFLDSDFRTDVRIAAQKLFPGKQKIAFILATNNAVLSEKNREDLEEVSVWHFNQDDIEYYEQLSDNLGFAAKYQLFGKLFENQHIPELKNKVPAIKGKISSGYEFYSFSIEPESLLKIGFVLHRTETNSDTANAYQRLIKKTRLNSIGNYINNGGYFPNSIIINIETPTNKPLQFDKASLMSHDSETDLGVLHLPKRYRSAFIIDGQHRLYGYTKADLSSRHLVPIVAFHNLPQEEQTKIFVDINHQQKSVPANLLRSIMADFNWNSENASAAVSALKTRLLTDMNYDEASPLYKRIVIAEEKKTQTRCLTLQSLLSWGLNTKVNFFGRVKGKTLVEPGYLTKDTYEKTLYKSLEFFNKCFRKFEDELSEQWELGNSEGGFIAMNIGVSSIFRISNDILEHLVDKEYLAPQSLSGNELADEVLPLLEPIIDFIKSLDSEGLKKLRSLYGGGATDKVAREFQNAVHQRYDSFTPEGLDKWIRDSSGVYNSKARDLGHNLVLQRDFG